MNNGISVSFKRGHVNILVKIENQEKYTKDDLKKIEEKLFRDPKSWCKVNDILFYIREINKNVLGTINNPEEYETSLRINEDEYMVLSVEKTVFKNKYVIYKQKYAGKYKYEYETILELYIDNNDSNESFIGLKTLRASKMDDILEWTGKFKTETAKILEEYERSLRDESAHFMEKNFG